MILLQNIHFFCIFMYAIMAGYIFLKDPKSLLNKICALIIGSFAIWNFVDVFAPHTNISLETAILFQNISSIGWISFASILLSFSLVFSKKEKLLKNKWFLFLIIIMPLALIIGQFSQGVTGNPIKGDFGWEFSWVNTVWSYLYFFYYISFTLISIYIIYKFKSKTKISIEKKQARLMVVTLIISLIGGTIISKLRVVEARDPA